MQVKFRYTRPESLEYHEYFMDCHNANAIQRNRYGLILVDSACNRQFHCRNCLVLRKLGVCDHLDRVLLSCGWSFMAISSSKAL